MFVIFSMVLNEAKFLKHSVRSWLASDLVQAVVVVEGSVENTRDYATPEGLSKDDTWGVLQRLKSEFNDRLITKQVGRVNGKRELQNAALAIIHADVQPKPKWVIIAGADELYRWQEINTLAQVARSTQANVLLYPFWHFWRRPDVVAVGSSWRMWMHRCYRYFPNLRFKTHNSCPLPSGRHVRVEKGVFVYHYVGMQDWETTKAKLDLYARRDGGRLNVTDTWSNWEWGDPTQWTHGAGSAKRFKGNHPDVIVSEVWDLLPKINGKVMAAPLVPWEAELMNSIMVCVDQDLLDDKDYQRVVKLVSEETQEAFFVSLDTEMVGMEWEGIVIQSFQPEVFSTVDMNLCIGYPYLAGICPRNLLVTKKAIPQRQAIGFIIANPDSLEVFGDLTDKTKQEVPKYKPIIPEGVVPVDYKDTIVRSAPVTIQTTVGGITGQKQVFTLHNTADRPITGADKIVCTWLSAFGKPIQGAAKTSQSAPLCAVGQVKNVKVNIPRPPLTVGSLILDIAVVADKLPLGIGARVKMRFRG